MLISMPTASRLKTSTILFRQALSIPPHNSECILPVDNIRMSARLMANNRLQDCASLLSCWNDLDLNGRLRRLGQLHRQFIEGRRTDASAVAFSRRRLNDARLKE